MSYNCNVTPVQHFGNPAPTHRPQWWTIHAGPLHLKEAHTTTSREKLDEIASKWYSQFIQFPISGKTQEEVDADVNEDVVDDEEDLLHAGAN